MCCAQAPSPNALTRTATTTIVFNSFNLSRLLSPQVAPVCLGREQRGSNAFLKFFGRITNREPDLFRVSGCSRACGHGFFPLSASTKTQSSGHNGHDHDRFNNFQFYLASFRRKLQVTRLSHTEATFLFAFLDVSPALFDLTPRDRGVTASAVGNDQDDISHIVFSIRRFAQPIPRLRPESPRQPTQKVQ